MQRDQAFGLATPTFPPALFLPREGAEGMIPSPEGASPTMAQWFRLKEQHPDAILFLRMGDFFEMFFADAEAAAAASTRARRSRCAASTSATPRCTFRA